MMLNISMKIGGVGSRIEGDISLGFRLILFVFVLPFGSMLKRLDLRVR